MLTDALARFRAVSEFFRFVSEDVCLFFIVAFTALEGQYERRPAGLIVVRFTDPPLIKLRHLDTICLLKTELFGPNPSLLRVIIPPSQTQMLA